MRVDPEPNIRASLISRTDGKSDHAHSFVTKATLVFMVTALPEVSPGEHRIAVLVNYDALNAQGSLGWQELALRVPVKVVAALPNVQERPGQHWWEWLLVIPMVPLAPLWFLMQIVDLITGAPPEC